MEEERERHESAKAILSNWLHAPIRGQVEALQGYVFVIEGGAITQMIPPEDNENQERAKRDAASCWMDLSHMWIIPGLIDLHIHAPQFENLGHGLHWELEEWLGRLTFPTEAKFSDPAHAARVYPALVDHLLDQGTTCAVYFSSIHEESTILLAATCLEKGQRAFVGKVAMDNPLQCPPDYIETTQEALDSTERVILKIKEMSAQHRRNVVQPVITPRFLPSCTDHLLSGLGQLAKKYPDVLVQSHAAESEWVVEYAKERFSSTDPHIYHQFGLLRPKSLWAHSIYLTDEDVELIQREQAGVAHCPLSNFYFANAAFQLRHYERQGMDRIGLGTDISGGFSSSMWDSMRFGLVAGQALHHGVQPLLPLRGTPDSKLSPADAFWLATMGGARALDLEDQVGSFMIGKQFDAVGLRLPEWIPSCGLRSSPSPDHLVERLVYHGQPSWIGSVWVAGDQIRSFP